MRSTETAWKAKRPAVRWRLLRLSANPPTMRRATMLPMAPRLRAREAAVREAGAVLQERYLVDEEAGLGEQHEHEGHGQRPERERAHGLGKRPAAGLDLVAEASVAGGPVAGTAPSGGRRIWLGIPHQHEEDHGQAHDQRETAMTGVVSSRPPEAISQAPRGGRTTPAEETPVAEMLMARARRRMNQRAMMTFVETPRPCRRRPRGGRRRRKAARAPRRSRCSRS